MRGLLPRTTRSRVTREHENGYTPSVTGSDPSLVHLLDIEPDFAARLREDDRAEAREQLLLSCTTVPEGTWVLEGTDHQERTLGVIVVEGLLLQEISIAGRRSLHLLGRGDLVLPGAYPSDALDVTVRWTAASEAAIALLDDRLQAPFRLWPGLALGLMDRVALQLTRLAVQSAITRLPRVEDRLEATFWDLADRWGHMTPAGIHLPLALTHEVLARLVGGQRPTISLALRDLTDRGIVARRPDGSWLLAARTPSLAPSVHEQAPMIVARAAPDPSGPEAPERPAWQLSARQELLRTTQRIAAEQMLIEQQTSVNHGRYAETRRRSQDLRQRVASDRRSREAARIAPQPLLRRRGLGAPSAGSPH
jgi:CRP/FNR family cyclic AMP-dependent transcriptional regulator